MAIFLRRATGILFLGVLGLGGCGSPPLPVDNIPAKSIHTPSKSEIRRIVSLAPSATETLFALGLGERVIGITNYCAFPPETAGIERIGGYYNPNYEAIFRLKPNLVIHLSEHMREKNNLIKLDLPLLELDNTHVDGILDGIVKVGVSCGVEGQANKLVGDLKNRIKMVQDRFKDRQKPRVLVTIGRNMGDAGLKDVYAAGQGSLYHEVIELAGGLNVLGPSERAYPILSPESILLLDPWVIVDLVPDLERLDMTELEVKKEWLVLGQRSRAVSEDRVHIFTEAYVTVPGPRFVMLLEDMAEVFHPKTAVGGR